MAVQTPYVEYIKISRTDELGQDLTPTLEALTQIKLPFTNGVSTTYLITSTTKYNDYFLFGISKTGASAPLAADASTIDYAFSASLSDQVFSGTNTPGQGVSNPVPITSPSTNLFNIDNTKISINTYIQKEVTFTVNFTASITGGPAEAKILQNGIGTSTSVALSVGTSNNTLSFTVDSSSLSPDTYFELDLQAPLPSGPYSYTYQLQGNSSWVISSTAASGPTLETIPEPYLTSQFEGTDCDVLLNNVDLYQENPFLQDIDYSGNPFVPVNFNLLLSGSAAKGTVPESFFTVKSILNPTYESVNTVSEYNKEESAFTTQVSSGVFVAYFDSYQTIQNFNQEKYQTRFNLKYLITPEEELIEISNDPDILYTLLYNFGTNANPNITYPTLTNRFGQIDGSVKLRATTFSTGSFDTSGDANPLEWKGDYRNFLYQGNIQGIAYTTGSAPGISGSASEFQNIGGILFPASIGLTSAAELPSKAKEILTKNNIIAPSNTTS